MQSIKRALAVLNLIARDPEKPVRLGKLADLAGLNHATCAHIVKALVEEGFAEQAGVRQGYILGPAAYALGAGGPYRRDLTLAALPIMQELSNAIREHVVLGAVHGGGWVQLAEVEAEQDIQVRKSPVTRPNPYLAATGRLCLAFLPENELQSLIRRCGLPQPHEWPEAATLPELRRQIDAIRADKAAVRQTGDLLAMAVPVSENGRVTAALGIFAPLFRCPARRRATILRQLRNSARDLEKALEAKWRGEPPLRS